MTKQMFHFVVATAAVLALTPAYAENKASTSQWQEEFDISKCSLQTTGGNPYLILDPGFQLVLEGGDTRVQITVLDETKVVDGVTTRVVEEREWKKGELYEVSKNYFALCEQTKDVFYFGEDVDFYEQGKVVKHDGSWLAGVNGNRAGLAMAGKPKLKMKYFQELAPGVAMDRAEIVSISETCKTPAGTFTGCIKVKEGSAIGLPVTEYKYYAPSIGLIKDEDLQLVKYGFVKN